MRNTCNCKKRGCESCRVKGETDTACKNEGSKEGCRKPSGTSRSVTGPALGSLLGSCPRKRCLRRCVGKHSTRPLLTLPCPAGIKYSKKSAAFFTLVEAFLASRRGHSQAF